MSERKPRRSELKANVTLGALKGEDCPVRAAGAPTATTDSYQLVSAPSAR
ncbi:hypothetical protein PSQ19_02700 [Devosia algicola]|uniref:Uncharacterized protein n=1 Tax=Devosia algicola TaxID=3026418 RepID=A0ABY7YP91_9HYPH|nr:hypothetical protein [Devosia algicola]WDR03123.1 hypothetical protein PSQ19_02700 [Devosia algicola]